MRKSLSLCTLFLFSLLLAISCTPYGGDSREIQVGFSVWPGWLPWQIAANENLFTANNIQVNLKWFDGYLDSINALS